MRLIFLFVCFIAITSCSKQITNSGDYNYEMPTNSNDGISVRDIKAYNIDTSLIAELNKDLTDEEIYNVHSLLIYKGNALFFEKYLRG